MRAKVITLAAVLMIATLAACGTKDEPKAKVAEIPSVVGLEMQDAQRKLAAAGFKTLKMEDRVSDRKVTSESDWLVFDQNPKAGSKAATDFEVTLGAIKKGDPIPGSASSTTATTPPTTPTPTVPTAAPTTTRPPATAPPATAAKSAAYANCAAARAAGAAPVHRGDPGYGSHLDRDGDGVACE